MYVITFQNKTRLFCQNMVSLQFCYNQEYIKEFVFKYETSWCNNRLDMQDCIIK